MDSQGRLHMPGFVGESFEETGVLKERTALSEAPRGPRPPTKSKYQPHQGKREMKRRRKQLLKA